MSIHSERTQKIYILFLLWKHKLNEGCVTLYSWKISFAISFISMIPHRSNVVITFGKLSADSHISSSMVKEIVLGL